MAVEDVPSPLRKLLRSARMKHFPRGQLIFYVGDMPGEVFFITAGAVKIYDISDQGNEKILHIVKAPAVLPLAFFLGASAPLQWFYATLTDCDFYILPKDELQCSMEADNLLAAFLMKSFYVDVHELLVRLSSLEKTNVRNKLIASLKFLTVRHARRRPSGWWRVSFSVNHQLLADLSGVTRESASMAMKGLQEEKIIRNPRLTILEINRAKLVNTE